jgi:hypothetical protein
MPFLVGRRSRTSACARGAGSERWCIPASRSIRPLASVTGRATPLEGLISHPSLFPNGIATAPDGRLYVADDTLGPLPVDLLNRKWQKVTRSRPDTLRGIDCRAFGLCRAND